VIALADHEGFPAHANAERIRIGTYDISGGSGGSGG
jgi:hypothetical protein